MAVAAPPATNKKAAKAAKKGKGGKKKGKGGLIVLLAFIVVVLGAVLLIAFNVFGLRDDVVMPLLRNTPVINKLIPEDPDAQVSLAQKNIMLEEAMAALELQLAQPEAANDKLAGDLELIERALTLNDLELTRLREIESGQVAFANSRERFEREVQRLLAYPTRAMVIEATWPELERGGWRSRVTPAAAIGSLLGWVAAGLVER